MGPGQLSGRRGQKVHEEEWHWPGCGHWTELLAWLDSAPGQAGQGCWPQARIACILICFKLVFVINQGLSAVSELTTEDQNWSGTPKNIQKTIFLFARRRISWSSLVGVWLVIYSTDWSTARANWQLIGCSMGWQLMGWQCISWGN